MNSIKSDTFHIICLHHKIQKNFQNLIYKEMNSNNYEQKLFTQLESYQIQDFQCSLCKCFMGEPFYNNCCDTMICFVCKTQGESIGKQCSCCHEQNQKAIFIKRLDTKMSAQIFRCPLSDLCEFSGNYKLIKLHAEKECLFCVELCLHCSGTFKSGEMKEHVLEICPKVAMSCPSGCEQSVIREDLDLHKLECSKIELPCPYKWYGCAFVGNRAQIQHHLVNMAPAHSKEASDFVAELKEQHTIFTEKMQNNISHLRTVNLSLNQKISTLESEKIELEKQNNATFTKIYDKRMKLEKELQKSTEEIASLKLLVVK